MEKIIKILIVFALLIFIISRFIRSRDRKFREYVFSHRIPDVPDADEPEGFSSIISHEGIASITDPAAGIVYNYTVDGMLTLYRQGSIKALQRLPVPSDAYYLSIDPIKEEIYLHHEGEVYIYKRSSEEA